MEAVYLLHHIFFPIAVSGDNEHFAQFEHNQEKI